jgi:hypothetical protein
MSELSGASSREAGFVCGDDELGSVAGAEFGEEAADVGLCGERADVEVVGDLVVAQPGGDELEDFAFALGESALAKASMTRRVTDGDRSA